MAYRLERDESVIVGLRRVVRDEIASATAHLAGDKKTNRDKAIHEARKSIKKVRALLRLMRSELGPTYALENGRLRDIAHRLSEFRDAFAMIATFDDLKRRYKKEVGSKMQSVRAGLVKKRRSAGSADVAAVLDDAVTALNRASKRVKTWPLQSDGYPAIGPGLEATYRAGRRALARARKAPRAENFHQLRKRVKDHWYHVRLLENVWAGMMSAYENSLKDLETWLGDDHNLVVLRARIVADPEFYGEQKDIELLLDLIDKLQKELRDQSMALAARIYEEKPRALNRRMSNLWETWRHEPRDLAEPPTVA